jgi:hypothetical protein
MVHHQGGSDVRLEDDHKVDPREYIRIDTQGVGFHMVEGAEEPR